MNGNLRAAELTMVERVSRTVNALPLEDGDSALVRLARDYAETLDAVPLVAAGERGPEAAAIRKERADLLRTIGPLLLAVLAELGASPKARAAMRGPGRPAAGGRLAGARAAGGVS